MAKIRKNASAKESVAGEAKSMAKRAKAAETTAAAGEVTVDRRGEGRDRRGEDRRKNDVPVAVERRKGERRAKVSRRRQIDPTTCERDYSAEEVEFMSALEQYKRSSGRMFPTCSEILEVIRGLGYQKQPAAVAAAPAPGEAAAVAAETNAGVSA